MQTDNLTIKPHYPILDGLRGVATLFVVFFHFGEAHFKNVLNPVHHGYLAVDFFFLLSGFVVAYAYDDRWNRMSVWTFFKIRLIRLHPMVILAVIFGTVCFWLDPYTNGMQQVSLLKLIGVMLLSLTLLPSPDIRGYGETHSLIGPLWSLLQEYIANVLYAVFGKRITKGALVVLVLVSGAALTIMAIQVGHVGTGWGYKNFHLAIIRMMFPFFAGLLLFRTGKLIRIPFAFATCSIVIAVLFCLPYFKFNGLYEAVCIIIAFPIIISAGAGGQVKGYMAKVCNFLADISYPLYITHYPIIYIYMAWVIKKKPSPEHFVPIAIGSFLLMILIAYGSLKLYDLPVRRWLKRKVNLTSDTPSLATTVKVTRISENEMEEKSSFKR
jgi:peptidoglycan/LPS O-acetylase OafA/YrhL